MSGLEKRIVSIPPLMASTTTGLHRRGCWFSREGMFPHNMLLTYAAFAAWAALCLFYPYHSKVWVVLGTLVSKFSQSSL